MQEKFGVVIEAVTTGFKSKMNEIKNIGGQTAIKMAELRRTISDLKNEMRYIDPGTQAFKDYASAIDGAEKELKQLNAEQKKGSGFSSFGGILTSIKSKLKSLIPDTHKLSSSIEKMASKARNSFKKMVLGVLGARSAFLALRKAVSAYMSFDQNLSDRLSSAWAGLGAQLAPVIEFIINLFARAVAYINAFINALSGINLIAKANTKALNAQAGAARNANKALAAFDEINNINTDSGSGGGGSGSNQIDLPELSVSDFMKKLADEIKAGNWYEVGKTIAEKVNETLENINWEKIKEKAGNLGKNIALFLNGGIENTNWKLVGNTIAEGLNTAIEFLNNWVRTFNFKATGEALANTINGFFEKVDWSKLGDTISRSISGALDFGIKFFEKLDSKKVGESLETTLDNINWDEIGEKLADLIAKAIPDLYEIGKKVGKSLIIGIGDAFISFINDVNKKINKKLEEIGNDLTIDGEELGDYLLEGLINGLAMFAFGPILKMVLFDPFMKAIKNLFGIHSPSKVMEGIGKDLIQGLVQGIGNIWEKVKLTFEDFKTKVKDKFIETKDKVKDIIGDLIQGIKDKFKDVGVAVGEAVSGAVKNAINGVLSQAVKIINGFISAINGVISLINVIPGVKLSKLSKLSVPQLATGTNYVPEDQLAYIHKGEAVIPKKFNSAEYFNNYANNDETNQLLRQLINVVDEKDMNVSLDGKQISQSTVNYINQQSRILGRSVV